MIRIYRTVVVFQLVSYQKDHEANTDSGADHSSLVLTDTNVHNKNNNNLLAISMCFEFVSIFQH